MYPTELCWLTGNYTDDCVCEFCGHKGECSGYEDHDDNDDDDDQKGFVIMQITETKVKVSDLCKNYSDDGDGGVTGFDGVMI